MKRIFAFSKETVNKLIEICEGRIPADLFEKGIALLEREASKHYFNKGSEANLIRILNSVYDRFFFFRELTNYPHHAEIIIAIASNSNYLTDVVIRNPEFLYQVFDQNYLTSALKQEKLQEELKEGTARFLSFNSKLNFLRNYKRRLLLKIGLTDLLGLKDLKTITSDLSYLANAINAVLFEICLDEITGKYKIKSKIPAYALCSLGKLGGNELNYSSDVDLLLFYEDDKFFQGAKINFNEILTETAQLFIKSSTDITDKGYIYRIDFRLRPDGKFSPLCKKMNDYIKYYETRGENWERQMLIKLGFVCGDPKLFQKFKSLLLPYVFPSTYSSSLLEQIKIMKRNIEMKNYDANNIKLFWGGIRDIEFAVQALQLINGGKFKSIRSGNSLEAMEALSEMKLLTREEHNNFYNAYIFYRKIEHYLQLMNDNQTHLIPKDEEMLKKISRYLGFSNHQKFLARVNSYRERVRRIYDDILRTEEIKSSDLPAGVFKDYRRAEKNLIFLKSGTGILGQKEFDSRTIELFEKIEGKLHSAILNSRNPDLLLENFVKVMRASKYVSIWYKEFEDEAFFKDFLKLCEYCQRGIDLIDIDNFCGELLLTKKYLEPLTNNELAALTINQLIFICSVQFILGFATPEDISMYLTTFFEIKIAAFFDSLKIKCNFFVGSLGSLATSAINFGSDIDLLIVADETGILPEIQTDFQKAAVIMQDCFKPFEVDLRLRPEGKKSQLVWGISNYNDYLATRARVWEYQSLFKLKFIYGNQNLYSEFKSALVKNFSRLETTFIISEMKKMLSAIQQQLIRYQSNTFNIKKGRGGIISIEFVIQRIALCQPCYRDTYFASRITDLLERIKSELTATEYSVLSENYSRLRILEFAVQVIFNSNSDQIPSAPEKREILRNFLGLKSVAELNKLIDSIIKSNNKIYEKYLE